jgi:hypothetical protein
VYRQTDDLAVIWVVADIASELYGTRYKNSLIEAELYDTRYKSSLIQDVI